MQLSKLITQVPIWVMLIFVSNSAVARSFPEFTTLVQESSAAVVNITANRATQRPPVDEFRGREMPEFFRRFFDQQQPKNRPSAGSGFIVSADGYILTNNHVVDGADEIIVALSDRRERVALLVGADPLSDLALLKIDETDLPVVKIGSSEGLQVGEWVVAIGSPFGFELSVTAGIVSAKGRSLPDDSGNYVPYIQTDVAINPGNSGGPLFNLEGKVVGINSQIFTRSGGFMGLSFAIPIDVAMEVVEQLKDKGIVSRGWLGVLIQRVDRDLAESFGLERAAGALVTQILPASPAEQSDLQVGDIILKFDGRKIDLSSDLPHIVGRTKADSEVEVEVIRAGKSKQLSIRVGLLPARKEQRLSSRDKRIEGRLGIDVEDLGPEHQSEKLEAGVIVTRIGPGPAKTAGLRQGDIITMLNGEAIVATQQFVQVARKLPVAVAIPIRVVRNQRPEFLVIKIIDVAGR
ncbi:MAG: Do family serine endopeptidase [Pseudomonadales bacterium]|nr:Do family serine endopeptidase [Pseudomonadales bacterium]